MDYNSTFNHALVECGWSPNSFLKCLDDTIDTNNKSEIYTPNKIVRKRRTGILSPPLKSTECIKQVTKILNMNKTPVITKKFKEKLSTNSHVQTTEGSTLVDLTSSQSPNQEENVNENLKIEELTLSFSKQKLYKSSSDENCINLCSKFRSAKDIYLSNKENVNSNISISISNNNQEQLKISIIKAAKLDELLPNGWNLYEHQKDSVKKCILLERVILAVDMGLGKTIISLCWAKAVSTSIPNTITLVIAPCTLQETWKREAEMLGFKCVKLEDLKKYHSKSQTPYIVIVSWSKIPQVDELVSNYYSRDMKYLLIGDEAHAMQSLSSIRTQSALKLCLNSKCIGTVLSTGTPMKNGRPCNILPLLIAIRHPVAKNKVEFEKRYCDAKKTKFCLWDTSGATNLDELKSNIESHLIRKTKEECLDLPPLQRSHFKLEMDGNNLQEYNTLIASIKSKSSKPSHPKQTYNGVAVNHLELLSKLRIVTSLSKVEGTGEYILKRFVENLDPIVVFVWFKETSYLLREHIMQKSSYSCECLTGDILNQSNRQILVDNFQNNKLDILICTYGVGSTGLTLTRSHCVILVDRPWTPGDVLQAEDRIRRIGQKSKVVESIWIKINAMDDKLDKLLQSKDTSCQKILSKGTLTKFFNGNTDNSSKNVDIRQYFGLNNEIDEDNEKTKEKSVQSRLLLELIQ